MSDPDPVLLERLEADLAAVEHAIERLDGILADDGSADRIRSVVEVAPFLDAHDAQS